MKRKRKFDLKGKSVTFIQEAVEPKQKNAKIIAGCWNKVLKHSIVHIRRSSVVSAMVKNDEDYQNMRKFMKRVNQRNKELREQKHEQEIRQFRAMVINFERRAEFACRYVISNPIEGDITKESLDERGISILKSRQNTGAEFWRLKQGDAIVNLLFKGETMDHFKQWLHDTYGECLTENGIVKEQVITPFNQQ